MTYHDAAEWQRRIREAVEDVELWEIELADVPVAQLEALYAA